MSITLTSILYTICKGYNVDIGDNIDDTAMIARQILQLPPEVINSTVTTQSSEPRDPRPSIPSGPPGLVIGLVVVAIVLTVTLIVVTAFIVWKRIRKIRR